LRGFFVILWLGSQTCTSLAGISILIALAQHFHHYSIPLLVQFDCFLNVSVTGLFFKLFIIICFDDKMVAKSKIDSLPAFRYLLADDTFYFLILYFLFLYSHVVRLALHIVLRQFRHVRNVGMLREVGGHLELIATCDTEGLKVPPLGFAFAYDCYALFYCHTQLFCFKVNTPEERQIHQLALFVGVVWIHSLVEAER